MSGGASPLRPHGLLLPAFLLVLLGTNWGSAFSLAKIGAMSGIPAVGYGLWLALGAGLVLLALCAYRRELPPITRIHLRYYLICGITGAAFPMVNMVLVLQHLPVGIMAILVTTAPIFTWLLSQLFRIEPFDRMRLAGVAVGLLGTLILLVPRASLPDPEVATWALVGVLTPLSYAGSNIYAGVHRPGGVNSLGLAATMQLAAVVGLIPIAWLWGAFHPLWPPFHAGEYALFGHMAVAAIGSILYFEVMRMAGPVFLSQVGYVVTVTGMLWGMALFGERHSPLIWVAVLVIFCGLALVTRSFSLRRLRSGSG